LKPPDKGVAVTANRDKGGKEQPASARRGGERRAGAERRGILRWDPRAKERRAPKDRRRK